MAVAPVVIEFLSKGIPDVQRAFRSVEDAVARSEGRTARIVGQSARAKEREYQKVAREAERWKREEARAMERALRDELRAEERNAKRVLGIRERSATAAGRLAAKAAAAETREAERTAARIHAIRERSATMAGRLAAKQVADEDRVRKQQAREAERDMRDAAQRRMSFANAIGRGAAQGVSTITRGVGRVASSVAQLGGGFSVQDAVQQQANFERQATMLANKSEGRLTGKDVMAQVGAASIESGTDRSDLLSAWSAFTEKTGSFEEGRRNMPFFGKLAKATGSDLTQVATAAGRLRVQNKGLDEKAMRQLMLDVIAQGRTGAVDVPELAGHAAEITKTSSAYAGNQTDTQRRLLALSQVGVRTGSVAETATSIANLSADATKHRKEITALLGSDPFNEKGQIAKSPEEFMADVVAATGGNRGRLVTDPSGKRLFGDRTLRLFDAILPTYNDAESEALGRGMSKKDATAYARKRTLEDMQKFTNAKFTGADMNREFAAIMRTSAEQFEGAVRMLKTEVGEKLLPELVKLVPVIANLTPQLVKLLDAVIRMANWAAENPFKGLAIVLGEKITEQIVAAQIGNTIKNLLTGGGGGGGVGGIANMAVQNAGSSSATNMAGSAAGGAVANGAKPGGAPGNAGAATAGVALSLMLMADKADQIYDATSSGSKRADELIAGANTEEGVARAKAELEAAKAVATPFERGAAWAQNAVDMYGRSTIAAPVLGASEWFGGKINKYFGSGVDEDAGVAHRKKVLQAAEIVKREEEINAAAKKLAEAMAKAANTVDSASTANPNAPNRNQPIFSRGGTQ